MRKNEKITTGWQIPMDVKEKFVNFCVKVGALAQEDCAGALTIWPYLPPAIREQAKLQAKGIAAVDEKFWDAFRAGLELALQAQSDTRQEKRGNKPRRK